MVKVFIPGAHKGLYRLRADDSLVQRYSERPNIRAVAYCESVSLRNLCLRTARKIRKRYTARAAIEFPTILSEVTNVTIRGETIKVAGKSLLVGEHGVRYRNSLRRSGDGDLRAFIERILADATRTNASPPPLTTKMPAEWRDLPLILPARNLFNYYHFMSETALYLTLCERYGLGGEIVVTTKAQDRRASFIERIVSSLFPELADRIRFTDAKEAFPAALFPLNTRLFYHYTVPEVMPNIAEEVIPQRGHWGSKRADANNVKIIKSNAFETALADLRDRALTQVDPDATLRRCCRTLIAKDSHRESMRLEGTHEQARSRPLPHDELVQLLCFAS